MGQNWRRNFGGYEPLFRIEPGPRLSDEEDRALLSAVGEGDAAARERLILSKMPLVRHVAKRYRDRGLSPEDLVGEGILGLITAVDWYPRGPRESPFLKCAYLCIKWAICRGLLRTGSAFRWDQRIEDRMKEWERTASKLRQDAGREPSFDEVADTLGLAGIKRETARRAIQSRSPISGCDADGSCWLSGPADDPTDRMDASEMVSRGMDAIRPRYRELLTLRFGIRDGRALTGAEIAGRLGVSPQRVRQIETKALRRLRLLLTSGKMFPGGAERIVEQIEHAYRARREEVARDERAARRGRELEAKARQEERAKLAEQARREAQARRDMAAYPGPRGILFAYANSLGDPDQEVALLHFGFGWRRPTDVYEVGDRLGLPPADVEKVVDRAVEAVRIAMLSADPGSYWDPTSLYTDTDRPSSGAARRASRGRRLRGRRVANHDQVVGVYL